MPNIYIYLFLACYALTKVSNAMASTASTEGPPALLTLYKKIYGSFANPNICKQNDFSIFQNYYLQKEIPVAMAGKIVIPRDIINMRGKYQTGKIHK